MVDRRRMSRYSPSPAPSQPSGCGCESDRKPSCGGNSARCKALIAELQSVDFSIVDTVLYLDAYPDCRKALAHYKTLIAEREALRRALAEECGMPTTAYENASDDAWEWVRGPWPWQIEANEAVGMNRKGRDRYVAL